MDILDRTYKPSLDEIDNYIEGDSNKRWKDLNKYLNNKFAPKIDIMYSVCKAKPGWNVKYKKGSTALCTLYPDKDYFTVLIVFNSLNMEWFKGIKDKCTKYVVERYEESGGLNGTKWVMLEVTNDAILNDVEKMINLKLEKEREK